MSLLVGVIILPTDLHDDKPTIGDVRDYIRDVCLVVKMFNSIVTEYLIDNFNVEDPWKNISK